MAGDPGYIKRSADEELHAALLQGRFCYVLEPRQVGKSSLMIQVCHRLRMAGARCAILNMTNICSETITPQQWFKTVIGELWLGFGLRSLVDLTAWWNQEPTESPLQRSLRFISEVLLPQFPGDRLYVFVDEIDRILDLNFPVDEFFTLIQACIGRRANHPDFRRITFSLFGVATPKNLVSNPVHSPFLQGQAIALKGFTLDAIAPLAEPLSVFSGSRQVLCQTILKWTNGQPFLTQKLFHQIAQVQSANPAALPRLIPGYEARWVEYLVRQTILNHWESQDEPEHLRTIRDRLLRHSYQVAERLHWYEQVLRDISVPADGSDLQAELLLSGLVVQQEGCLRVKNRIYRTVFNTAWVERQWCHLRAEPQLGQGWIPPIPSAVPTPSVLPNPRRSEAIAPLTNDLLEGNRQPSVMLRIDREPGQEMPSRRLENFG